MRDLLVGSEGGEIRCYRNTGKNDAPRYAAAVQLLNAGNSGWEPEGSVPKQHGGRVKVHVTDWNEDGKADLLVGDVTWQESKLTPLTAAEEKTKEALERDYADLKQRVRNAKDDNEKAAAQQSLKEVREKLQPLDRTKVHTHGWVWLYLRSGKTAR